MCVVVVSPRSLPMTTTTTTATTTMTNLYPPHPTIASSRTDVIPFTTNDLLSRIPTEIWSTVFYFAIHDTTTTSTDDDTGTIFPGMFPLTLSHVCKRWRSIALETGNMWTNITLTFPSTPTQLSRADAWAKRSGSYSLDLLLDFRDPEWDWDEDSQLASGEQDIRDVMSVLLPYVNRWRTFELLTDTWLPIHTFLQIFSSLDNTVVLRKLEKIGLQRCNAYFASRNEVFAPAELKAPLKLFSGTTSFPVLRKVTLVGVHIDWTRSMRCFSGLTTLEFKYQAREVMPCLRTFLQILRACAPTLQQLTILGWGVSDMSPENDDNEDDKRVTLTNLESLSFGFLDVDYAQSLLGLFHLPSLRYLALEDISKGVDFTEILDAGPLLSWIVSQSCSHTDPRNDDASPSTSPPSSCSCDMTFKLGKLVHLTLGGVRSGKEVFQSFLGRLSKVRHLEISSMPDHSANAVDALSLTSCCPRLRKVSLNKCSYQDCSRLCEMVTKRRFLPSSQDSQVVKISDVTVRFDRHRPVDERDKDICNKMLDFLVICGINVIVYD